jgi:hypothetical protein
VNRALATSGAETSDRIHRLTRLSVTGNAESFVSLGSSASALSGLAVIASATSSRLTMFVNRSTEGLEHRTDQTCLATPKRQIELLIRGLNVRRRS